VNNVVNDPNYLAYGFDFNTENVVFLPVQRDEIRRVSCLKRDFIDPERQFLQVPLAQLVDLVNASAQALRDNPPRFIFHTAFCSSTFLSRCLDVEGTSVSLREPQLLLDAANAKRMEWKSNTTSLDYSHLPKLALALLQKHATANEKLILKPINSVNNIIPELLQVTGPTRSLMLFTNARNFILSTLKKGEGGKQTVRSMFDLLRCDFPHLANLQLTHTIHMTDMRISMTLWRLQIEQAENVVRQFSANNEMASLYGEELIDRPLEVLKAANEFLGLGISAEQVQAIAGGDQRFNDAKNAGEQFSKEKRAATYEQLEKFYGADLDDGLEWLVRNNPGSKLHPELSGVLQL
jgi:hypothetical protein